MELRLDGKVAVVTGASRGIGRAIAESYAAAGAKVVLSSRKLDALQGVAAMMPGETDVFAANVGRPDDARACVEFALDRFGAVDVLVNNAATNPYFGPSIGIDVPRYDKTFEVNLRGPLTWIQAAHDLWMAEHGGVVVNIASVGGFLTSSTIGIYNTTKAGLVYLTRTLAGELGPAVRVNAIAPGLVVTEMAQALLEQRGERTRERLPLRRLGEPSDIANAALFFASDASSWITGQTLIVDGGSFVAAVA